MDNCSNAQMCGYYSITTERKYEASASSLKYFKMPKVPMDLNENIKNIILKPDAYYDEKMDSILNYIVINKADLMDNKNHRTEGTPLIPSTTYITYRGVISKIMQSPYESFGWCILATKYKGNIYLCQYTKPEQRSQSYPKWFQVMCNYGPKFEQYCLTDDPNISPNTSERVDASSQFFCVIKRNIVGRKFFFAGEMDGVISDKRIDFNNVETYKDIKFVELKVTGRPNNNSKNLKFENDTCQRAWVQSFLTGVNNIYFGFRDHYGIVRNIEHFDLNQLHSKWTKHCNATNCFEFLNIFLKLVETTMEVDCPHSVCEFNYDKNTRQITQKYHKGKSNLSLIPQWYIDAGNS